MRHFVVYFTLGTQASLGEGQQMAMTRRIFVSSPRDEHLDNRRNELKWAIVKEIEALGYEPQVFGSSKGGDGLPSGRAWSAKEADEVMQRCIGAAILGFPIWQCLGPEGGKTVSLVTEYCHYEGALARAYRLPILAVLEGRRGGKSLLQSLRWRPPDQTSYAGPAHVGHGEYFS